MCCRRKRKRSFEIAAEVHGEMIEGIAPLMLTRCTEPEPSRACC